MKSPKKKTPKPPKVGSLKWAEIPEEDLDWDKETREACIQCPLYNSHFGGWNTDSPGWNGKVLALGLSPNWLGNEDTSELFWRAVGEANLTRYDIFTSSVLRCEPGTKDPGIKELRACRPGVLKLIEELQPEKILLFGSKTHNSFANCGKDYGVISVRGRPNHYLTLGAKYILVYTTYDPNHINLTVQGRTQTHLYHYLVRDLKRVNEGLIEEPVDIHPIPGYLNGKSILAIDMEYTPKKLLDVSFANGTMARNYRWDDPEDGFLIVSQLNQLDCIAGHNLAGAEMDQLVKYGIAKETWVQGKDILDSMLIGHNVDDNRGPGGFKLENMLAQCVTFEGWKHETEKDSKKDPTLWDPEDRAKRCRKDAWASAIIIKNTLNDAQGNLVITHRTAQDIHRLALAGAYVDYTVLYKMKRELESTMEENKEKFLMITAKDYNKSLELTKDDHIRDFLYKHRKIEILGKTPKGLPSIEAKYVEYYAESQPDLIYLCEYLKAHKIYSTYVNNLEEKLDANGWLPVDIGMLTRTGRRHSSWHTWPSSVRGLIKSRYKNGMIHGFDFEKLEIIIMSVMAKEWKLYEYFTKGNGYIGIGQELLGVKIEKDTRNYTLTKATVFGLNYGSGSPWLLAQKLWFEDKIRLAETLDNHEKEVYIIVNKYFKIFPRLNVYKKIQEEKLNRYQYVELPDERRRHLPLPLGRRTKAYRHIVNEAVNNPIQGTAALLTGSALVDAVDNLLSQLHISHLEYHKMLLNKEWPIGVMWNEVHDALYFDSIEEYYTKTVKNSMENLETFRSICPQFKDIEFKVEMKKGSHWQ